MSCIASRMMEELQGDAAAGGGDGDGGGGREIGGLVKRGTMKPNTTLQGDWIRSDYIKKKER